MLISDTHRFIFVHVRRAAGTTLRRYLAPYALPRRRGLLVRAASRLGMVNHYHKHAFRAHAPLSTAWRTMPRERFDHYFKFAFVRNPWERLASEYEYIRRRPTHARHRRVAGMSFSEFVHFQAAREDGDEALMLRGPAGSLGVDFIGRVERLQLDFNEVCERIGIPLVTLPRLNQGTTKDYRRYYEDETARFVEQTWGGVIGTFGYRFDQVR